MADQSLDILNRLRNLPQYKNSKITDEELLEIYLNRDNASKVKDMAIDDRFIDNTEKKEARTLLRKYLREYTIESTAEKQELSDLIFLEILNKRLQKELNEINNSEKKKDTPVKLIEALHKNLTQIAEKKKILGLFKSQDSNGQDPFSYIQLLKKKFKFWLESNQLSRHFICVSAGTKVTMSDFLTKNIEDIKIGDEIIGAVPVKHSGIKLKKQKVLNWTFSGEKECLRLKTSYGRELVCTPDHLIFSFVRSKNKRGTQQLYFPAENTLRREVKTFNSINNLHDYYKGVLLGLIESDGWLEIPKDLTHPEWNFTPRYYICQSSKKELVSIEFILKYFNINYKKSFKSAGLGDGAYTFYIPVEYTEFIDNIKDELLKNKDIAFGFLSGFILGDGYVDKLGNCYITQKNKIELLENVFANLNIQFTKVKASNIVKDIFLYSLRKQVPLIVPDSKKSLKFLNRVFLNGSHYTNEVIVSLELIGIRKVYDITTETENFIANGLIVHNCPHCAKEIWLKLRNDMWETLKHPFLKDRMVCNEELLALYLQERITKKNIARIFGTSEDYIDWVLGKMNPDTVRDLKTKNIDK